MNKEQLYNQIEKFLDGKMSAKEKKAFQNKLESQPELQEELQHHQMARKAVKVLIQDNLRKDIKQWEAEEEPEAKPKAGRIISMRRIFTLSAAAAVLLLIGFFIIRWVGSGPDTAQLYASYYTPPILPIDRDTSQIDHPFKVGLLALQGGDWPAAIAYFEQATPNEVEAQYYLAHAQLQAGEIEAARASFARVVAQDTTDFSPKAEWYGLLTYLKAGQITPAFTEQLTKIVSNPDHLYHQRAIDLQQEINLR